MAHHRIMATVERGSLGLRIEAMKKPITIAPIVLFVALTLSIALADRMKERASHDRFSFDDSGTTELVAR